ncbi:MAG: CSLREA domain-containing protein [Cryomorphaceae bacterium]|jgi:CSLREA domain-containing protein
MPPLNTLTRSCLAVAIGQAVLIPVQAATITVDSYLDNNGTGCTLREAITQANNTATLSNGCVSGSVGTDTIMFSNSLASNTIALSGSELSISGKDIEINASNISGGITVDANN